MTGPYTPYKRDRVAVVYRASAGYCTLCGFMYHNGYFLSLTEWHLFLDNYLNWDDVNCIICVKSKRQKRIFFTNVMNPSCKTKEPFKEQVFISAVASKWAIDEAETLQTLACFLHACITLRNLHGKPCSLCINFSMTPSDLCALCIQFSTAAGSHCYTEENVMSSANRVFHVKQHIDLYIKSSFTEHLQEAYGLRKGVSDK